MRTIREISLISVTLAALAALATVVPAHAQTAADAALDMANMLDGAGGGVSGDAYVAALEDAAEAGQPMAMWQLGTMYENGEGVDKDPAKAFGYFAQIANQHADAAPRGVEADIVAQSFVKDCHDCEAGIQPDEIGQFQRPHRMVGTQLHRRIDRLHRAYALVQGVDCFVDHRQQYTVDDEGWEVLGPYGDLA